MRNDFLETHRLTCGRSNRGERSLAPHENFSSNSGPRIAARDRLGHRERILSARGIAQEEHGQEGFSVPHVEHTARPFFQLEISADCPSDTDRPLTGTRDEVFSHFTFPLRGLPSDDFFRLDLGLCRSHFPHVYRGDSPDRYRYLDVPTELPLDFESRFHATLIGRVYLETRGESIDLQFSYNSQDAIWARQSDPR